MALPSFHIFAYIPNCLTILRLIGALFFSWIQDPVSRCALLLGMALTDFLDGFLARKYNLQSPTGIILDPIADKTVAVVCSYVFLSEGLIEWRQAMCLFTREIALFIFMGLLLAHGQWGVWKIQSFWVGKIMTTAQFLLFLCLALHVQPDNAVYYGLALLGACSFVELYARKVALCPASHPGE